MEVCPKQTIPTLEQAMHRFLRIKLKTLKRKEKHNLSWLSNYQLRLQIPGDPYSFSSGIRAFLTEKSEKKMVKRKKNDYTYTPNYVSSLM